MVGSFMPTPELDQVAPSPLPQQDDRSEDDFQTRRLHVPCSRVSNSNNVMCALQETPTPDGLPEKQADLERRMLEWYQLTWDNEPAPSMVRARVTAFYAL